ncbi:MAG: hypothetical protein PHE68_05300 [Candidatus Peribacteraceae bacterium]|nr:hypothetical protein [Candidatus Peribacteraceae bacterium]MDD5074540.1 hypothetical protein [Candidatus Peribacteraceae bacterium]
MKKLFHHRPGAMLLLTVLVLGGVAIAIVLSVALRGIGEMGMGIGETRSQEAFSAADGCAEEALLRLTIDNEYAGGTYMLGNSTCTVVVTAGAPNRYTIDVAAVRDRWTRRIQIRANTSGTRLVVTWWRQNP